MYIPKAFEVKDLDKIAQVIETYNFATLVTCDSGIPMASHIPFLYDRDRGKYGTLISHMARANSQWQSFDDQEILAIFQGSHSYISPNWYQTKPAVCTWNYIAIHTYGVPQVITDIQRTEEILQATVAKYESQLPDPWDGSLPEKVQQQLGKALVGFEIPLTRIEAKFKLGQNRSAEDLQGVYDVLVNSTDVNQKQIAAMMKQENLIF